MARSWTGARAFLISGGAVYLVLWIYGLIVDTESQANFVPLDTDDDWLHPFWAWCWSAWASCPSSADVRRVARGSATPVGGDIR